MQKILQIVFIAALVLTIVGNANAYECTPAIYQKARAEMSNAFDARILENDKHSGVLIDDHFWQVLTINEKQSFADRLSCAVAGVGKGLPDFVIRSRMTGKRVGEYSWGRLTIP